MIKRKYIATLLLICFSVLIGHSIIPHHHHTELGTEQKCPLEHNDHNSSSEHSGHCHAFNGVAYFYARTATLPKINLTTTLFVAAETPGLLIPRLVSNLIVPLDIPVPSLVPDASPNLRGPPRNA